MTLSVKLDDTTLLSVGNTILNSAGRDDFVHTTLRTLAHMTQSQSAIYMRCSANEDGMAPISVAAYRVPEVQIGRYCGLFYQDDPIYHRIKTAISQGNQLAPHCLSLSKIRPANSRRNSTFFRDFLAPYGVDDILTLVIPQLGYDRIMHTVNLHRKRGAGPYQLSDSDALTALSPSVAAASRLSYLEARLGLQDAVSKVLEGDRGDEVIEVLSKDGACLFSREEASGIVHKPKAGLRYQPSVSENQTSKRRDFDKIVIDGYELFVRRCSQKAALYEPRLKTEEYALTPREAEVAGLAVSGLKTKEISARLGIACRTVENHFRAIYSKTQSHNRADLTRNLLS